MRPTAAVSMAVLAGSLAAAAAVVFAMARRPVDQPIAFNHRLHVQDLGLDCTDCHRYARSGARATIPNLEVCGDCHDEAQTDSPEEARLVEHIQGGAPIPWRKVYWVADHVYFSHRRHTTIAEIECERCHGEVGTREEPLRRPLLPLSMAGCIECHEETGARNDCILCHV